MILSELFLSFLQIGLFSVGGGYAAIPLIQYQTVELHGWLTETQFMDLAAIAEMTPGPVAINGATFVGLKIAGVPGALAATLGCIFPSLIIVSLLAFVYRKYRELPVLRNVLSSLRPAVVASALRMRVLRAPAVQNKSHRCHGCLRGSGPDSRPGRPPVKGRIRFGKAKPYLSSCQRGMRNWQSSGGRTENGLCRSFRMFFEYAGPRIRRAAEILGPGYPKGE